MVKGNTVRVRLILVGKTRSTRELLHHRLGTGTTRKVGVSTNGSKIGRPCGEIMVRNGADNGCARTVTGAGME